MRNKHYVERELEKLMNIKNIKANNLFMLTLNIDRQILS